MMKIPIRGGRPFDRRDTATSPEVVLINERAAQRFFPGQNPVGQQIRVGAELAREARSGPKTIVGVVGDIKYGGLDEDTPAETIAALKPDLLVKGADYTMREVVGAETVRAAGGRVLLLPLMRGHSTTSLIRRAADLEESRHPVTFQAADG